jgi:hypothetical protein
VSGGASTGPRRCLRHKLRGGVVVEDILKNISDTDKVLLRILTRHDLVQIGVPKDRVYPIELIKKPVSKKGGTV